jgi:UDP-3-O-[3-hydroxymyristoyl] N-acetylglucosamine deacetylase
MDGSALAFVEGIRRAGIVTLDTPRAMLRVTRRVEVGEGGARASFEPAARLEIDFEIAFPDAAIGVQRFVFTPAEGRFEAELAMCRTFCRRAEVEWMRDRGLIRGGSLDNAVVVEGGQVLTPGGFRVERECARHKVLDALGDLALAGLPILGRYTGVRAGHALTNRLLRRLFAEPGAVEHVAAPAPVRRRVPAEAFELSL